MALTAVSLRHCNTTPHNQKDFKNKLDISAAVVSSVVVVAAAVFASLLLSGAYTFGMPAGGTLATNLGYGCVGIGGAFACADLTTIFFRNRFSTVARAEITAQPPEAQVDTNQDRDSLPPHSSDDAVDSTAARPITTQSVENKSVTHEIVTTLSSSNTSTGQRALRSTVVPELPFDMLLMIFQQLDLMSLGRCRLVCKHWKILTLETNLLDSLNFHTVSPRLRIAPDWDQTALDEHELTFGTNVVCSREIIQRHWQEGLLLSVKDNSGVTFLTIPAGLTVKKIMGLLSPKTFFSGRSIDYIKNYSRDVVEKSYSIVITNNILQTNSTATESEEYVTPTLMETLTLIYVTLMTSNKYLPIRTRCTLVHERDFDIQLESFTYNSSHCCQLSGIYDNDCNRQTGGPLGWLRVKRFKEDGVFDNSVVVTRRPVVVEEVGEDEGTSVEEDEGTYGVE